MGGAVCLCVRVALLPGAGKLRPARRHHGCCLAVPCRKRLRETEGREGVSAAELADLQRQLQELMEQPMPLPVGSRPSSAGASWSSRPSFRPGSRRSAAAPLVKAQAAHQLPASPRIRAVQVAAQEAAAGSAAGSCAGLSARGEPAVPCEQVRG